MIPPNALDAIREKLQTAVQLELATIPPYLTAMFSIKPGKNIAAAKLVRSVFMEEMLHMVLAANVLSALGGKLKLKKPNIPSYPCRLKFQEQSFTDREFDIDLARLSRSTLETFMKIELPDFILGGMNLVAEFDEIVVKGITVGRFYTEIKADLRALCTTYSEPNE